MNGYRKQEREYTLGHFFVDRRADNAGKYRILKRESYYVTDAYIINDSSTWWERTPAFDSWIQAVRFLKENKKDLL